MKYYNYIKYCLLTLSFVLVGTNLTSCKDEIELSPDGDYGNIDDVYGAVKNVTGAREAATITIFGTDSGTGQIYFELTEVATGAVAVQLKVDQAALDAYNAANGTAYEMYPSQQVSFANNGVINIASGSKRSEAVDITITTNGEVGKTYALPIVAKVTEGGVAVSKANQSYVYLIKPYPAIPSSDKGTGIKAICYVEVNDENLLNVGEYTMASSGKPFFDVVNIFAANINYNSDTKRAYVNCNDNVSYILKNADKFIRPLQAKGIKVCLTILGNHDEAGVSNLSPEAAADFARELKSYVDVYGLDGVDFDDEYSKYNPANPGAGFVAPSRQAAGRLVYECRKIMPNKIISFYDYGSYVAAGTFDGIPVGEMLDYSYWGAYANWSDRHQNITGMTKKQYCPSSFNLDFSAGNGGYNLSHCRDIRQQGYGVQMFYNLKASYDYSSGFNQIGNILFDDDVEWSGYTYSKTAFSPDTYVPSYESYIGTWTLKPSQGLFYFISEDGNSRWWDWTSRVSFTLRIEADEVGKTYKVYGWGETEDNLPFVMNYTKHARVAINLPQTITDASGKQWEYIARRSYSLNLAYFIQDKVEPAFSGYLTSSGNFTMRGMRYNFTPVKTMAPTIFNGNSVSDIFGGLYQDVAYEPYVLSK